MAPRPRLKPYFRPLRRGPDSVQLGLSAESGGVILSGLGSADLMLLERLDGSLSEREVYAVAADCGVAHDRATELLTLLREHHLLTSDTLDRIDLGQLGASMRDSLVHDAEVLELLDDTPEDGFRRIAERRERHVLVSGTGRLPWSIATLLRASGIGRVDLGDWAVDATDHSLQGADQGAGQDAGRLPRPDLVVLVGAGVVDPRAGEAWRSREVAHLPVVGDGQRIIIGPLVGYARELPCLGCLEMARTDRDATWPTVMAQVLPDAGPAEVRSESTIVSIAAGVVGMVVHAFLDGDAVPPGVSIEVTMPWPRLDHRRWHRHPGCPNHDVPDRSGRPADEPVPPRVTMTG